MTPGNIERALRWACVVATLMAIAIWACLVLAGCGVGVPGYEVLYWEVLSKPAPGQVVVATQYGSTSAPRETVLLSVSMREWKQLEVGDTGTWYVETLPQLKGLTR